MTKQHNWNTLNVQQQYGLVTGDISIPVATQDRAVQYTGMLSLSPALSSAFSISINGQITAVE